MSTTLWHDRSPLNFLLQVDTWNVCVSMGRLGGVLIVVVVASPLPLFHNYNCQMKVKVGVSHSHPILIHALFQGRRGRTMIPKSLRYLIIHCPSFSIFLHLKFSHVFVHELNSLLAGSRNLLFLFIECLGLSNLNRKIHVIWPTCLPFDLSCVLGSTGWMGLGPRDKAR